MKQERLVIFLLACINFTHIMDFMIMMPLGPQLMRIFEIGPQEFSLIVSAYTFSAGIFGFLSAFFVDKYDRKKVLVIGYTGFILGTLACAFAPTYLFLVLARVFAGAFGGLIGAQVLSIIADLVPFERRGAAMGTLSTAFSVASVIGVPFGLYSASQLGWHAPFFAIAFTGFIVIPAIYFYLPAMTGHIQKKELKSNPLNVISNITNDNNQLRGLLLSVALMLGHFSIIPFLSPYMVSNVGFQEEELTYIYILGGVMVIFTAPWVGRMADKYGKFKMLSIFILLSVVPVFLITNLPKMPIYYVLILTSLFFVIINGRMIPAQALISSVVLPQHRGGFMSINSSLQQLASGTAAYMAGLIVTKNEAGELFNYNYVGYISIAISLACIYIAKGVKIVDQKIPQKKEELIS